MIQIHATKKLLAKLPIDEHGQLPLSAKSQFLAGRDTSISSPLSGWHANLLTIQRRNCVLLVHDETRFPLFIPALTKPDFANLDYWFGDALMNTLLKCGATEQQMDNAWAAAGRLYIDSQCDRSVQGSMNQVAQNLEHSLYYEGVNVAEITGHRLAAWLADRPCSLKGRKEFIWPKQAFLALLDTPSEISSSSETVPGA